MSTVGFARTHDDATLRGVDLAVADLTGLGDALEAGTRAAVEECTESACDDAVARWNATMGQSSRNSRDRQGRLRLTRRSGRYREAIKRVFFQGDDPTPVGPGQGDTGKVFVSFPIVDDRGKRPKNLPLWLEYGTLHTDARPHLLPAFEVAKARLDRMVSRLLETVGR